ncbi:MAG: hypothetical protein ACM3H8_14030 [Sphingobacteriales bacterium]
MGFEKIGTSFGFSWDPLLYSILPVEESQPFHRSVILLTLRAYFTQKRTTGRRR